MSSSEPKNKRRKRLNHHFECLPSELLEIILKKLAFHECYDFLEAFPDQKRRIPWKRLISILTDFGRVPPDWNIASEGDWNKTFREMSRVRRLMRTTSDADYPDCVDGKGPLSYPSTYFHEWDGDYFFDFKGHERPAYLYKTDFSGLTLVKRVRFEDNIEALVDLSRPQPGYCLYKHFLILSQSQSPDILLAKIDLMDNSLRTEKIPLDLKKWSRLQWSNKTYFVELLTKGGKCATFVAGLPLIFICDLESMTVERTVELPIDDRRFVFHVDHRPFFRNGLVLKFSSFGSNGDKPDKLVVVHDKGIRAIEADKECMAMDISADGDVIYALTVPLMNFSTVEIRAHDRQLGQWTALHEMDNENVAFLAEWSPRYQLRVSQEKSVVVALVMKVRSPRRVNICGILHRRGKERRLLFERNGFDVGGEFPSFAVCHDHFFICQKTAFSVFDIMTGIELHTSRMNPVGQHPYQLNTLNMLMVSSYNAVITYNDLHASFKYLSFLKTRCDADDEPLINN